MRSNRAPKQKGRAPLGERAPSLFGMEPPHEVCAADKTVSSPGYRGVIGRADATRHPLSWRLVPGWPGHASPVRRIRGDAADPRHEAVSMVNPGAAVIAECEALRRSHRAWRGAELLGLVGHWQGSLRARTEQERRESRETNKKG